MRQALRWLLGICFFAAVVPSAMGLGAIQLDRVFGGKGAGHGTFGEDIRVHVDDEGNVYVSDAEAKVVQKLNASGEFQWQVPRDPEQETLFQKPGDITTDPDGNLYVTDYTARYLTDTENPRVYIYAPCVYQFDLSGTLKDTLFLDEVTVRPKTVLPVKIILDEEGRSAYAIQPKYYDRTLRVAAAPDGSVYVLDIQMSVIHKLGADGKLIKTFGRYGAAEGEMDKPDDLTVDLQGNVWVADTGNHRVLKFSPEGEFALSIGQKGRGKAEFVKPKLIQATTRGLILVKDSSEFSRALYKSPAYGPTISDISGTSSRSYLFANRLFEQGKPDIASRVQMLEEAEYLRYLDESEGKETEPDPEREAQRLRNTLYHNVIERVQVFDANGRYRDRVLYRIDRQDAESHDLTCVALDSAGAIYLRDESDFTIQRYRTNGVGLQTSALNTVYTTRAQNGNNQFNEDYEDIDLNPDINDEENLFGWRQRLLLNYDLSERWNLSLQNQTIYNERDNRLVTPPKPEDSYTYSDQGWDNVVDFNLKFITNPNPYRYKELNLYAQRVDGRTDGGAKAILVDRNQQHSKGTGDSQAFVLGLNWDLFRNTNFALEFMNLNPDQTARNYTRTFYDVSGDLHEQFQSSSRAKVWSAELILSF